MSEKDTKDLLKFLEPFPEDVRETALWLRRFVWRMYPGANELIYDNYNAVAIGWSPTDRVSDTFCSIAIGRSSHNVHFGFYWGSRISDPEKMLLGQGNQYRYILVRDKKEFPKEYIRRLVKDAHAYSLSRMKPGGSPLKGKTITKSISPVKRKPRKLPPKK
jgi:hypothetical protein